MGQWKHNRSPWFYIYLSAFASSLWLVRQNRDCNADWAVDFTAKTCSLCSTLCSFVFSRVLQVSELMLSITKTLSFFEKRVRIIIQAEQRKKKFSLKKWHDDWLRWLDISMPVVSTVIYCHFCFFNPDVSAVTKIHAIWWCVWTDAH